MSKLLHRVLSYLLFVILEAFLVCSVRFQQVPDFFLNRVGQYIGGYLANIAQAVTGGSRRNPHGGDLFGFLMFFAMLANLISRHSNRMFSFQQWMSTHITLSPTNMISFSFGISLSYRYSLADDDLYTHLPYYAQLLILLIFSTAMFIRFSAADQPHDGDLSICSRLTSRAMEFSMYICFLPKYTVIWRWHFMAPLALLVCVSRSNQVFRIWQNNDERYQNFHDHVVVKRKFQRFYELAAERVEKDLLKIPWPKTGSTPTSSYRGYSTVREAPPNSEDRLDMLKDEVKKAGMYGYKEWKPHSQYCFFWSDGSGLLISSGITLNLIMLIVASSLHKAPEIWSSVLASVPIGGMFLYLVLQSVPGFVVFVADISNPSPDWWEWFHQIGTFMSVLVVEGLPLMRNERQPPWYVVVLHGVEGLELVAYVVVYALSRLIGLGLLFCILTLARITKLGVVLHWVWSKLEPGLAFYSAKITALDVMRVKSAILQAEIALDTRIQPCDASIGHVDGINLCTQLMDVKALLEDLGKALLGEKNDVGFDADGLCITDVDERRQAIAAGLYKSTMENLKDIEFPVDIAARLHPILGLLHRLHLHKPRCEAAHLVRVAQMLNSYTDNLWVRQRSISCLDQSDVRIMKVQLQVSMLLYHFDEPSIIHSITGVTLHEWLQIRRLVPGIEFCDFIL